MTYFNLGQAKIRRAVRAEKIFPTQARRGVQVLLLLVFFILAIVVFLLPLLSSFSPLFPNIQIGNHDQMLGLTFLAAVAALILWIYGLFYDDYWSKTELPRSSDNVADFLDVEAAMVVDAYVSGYLDNISALLFPILKKRGSEYICLRFGFSPKTLEDNLKEFLKALSVNGERSGEEKEEKNQKVAVLTQDILDDMAKAGESRFISWQDLFVALSERSEFLKKFLFDMHLEKKDLKIVAEWQRQIESDQVKRARFWSEENLMETEGVGSDWSSAYTVELDKYATDMTKEIKAGAFSEHLFGHDEEVQEIERVLARSGQNNVV